MALRMALKVPRRLQDRKKRGHAFFIRALSRGLCGGLRPATRLVLDSRRENYELRVTAFDGV